MAKLFKGESYRQPGAHWSSALGDAVAAIRREELQAPHVRVLAGGTVRGPGLGLHLQAGGLSARQTRTPSIWCCAPTTAWSIPEYRTGDRRPTGENYRVELVRGADRAALPAAAARRRGR